MKRLCRNSSRRTAAKAAQCSCVLVVLLCATTTGQVVETPPNQFQRSTAQLIPAGQNEQPADQRFAPQSSVGQLTPRSNENQRIESQTERQLIQVPLAPDVNDLRVTANDKNVSIFARDVDIRLVLGDLSEESGVNFVIAPGVTGTANTALTDVPLWQALDAILKVNGLVWTEQDSIVYVTRPGGAAGATAGEYSARSLLGQKLEVFDLDYVAGAEVLPVVSGLLSTAGSAHLHAVDSSNTRQTRERIVVEDFEDRLQIIANYLARIDIPPRQVLIEAHVLQVTLNKDQRHGVNLAGLARLAGARVELRTQGFANGEATPGFMMGVEGTDLDGMVEMLQSSSYVRTLAAPKVLVINGQEARIQIGSKFGYFETTTTQTGTFQNVNFLDIGVVLQVTPTITHDGQVMLAVSPKVSGGRVNPDTGLPEEDTTEAATTVILPDGKGMIIGGLIKEQDEHNKTWVPWLGERPLIGKLFRRSNDDKQNVEVVIALTPHIVPYNSCLADREAMAFIQSTDTHGVITGGIGPNTPANESSSDMHTDLNPFHQHQAINMPQTDFHDAIEKQAAIKDGSVEALPAQLPFSGLDLPEVPR